MSASGVLCRARARAPAPSPTYQPHSFRPHPPPPPRARSFYAVTKASSPPALFSLATLPSELPGGYAACSTRWLRYEAQGGEVKGVPCAADLSAL